MKTTFALAALAPKITMLLCVSFMGFFGSMQSSFAEGESPCHNQEPSTTNANSALCDMCETTLSDWDNDAVATDSVHTTKETKPVALKSTPAQNNSFESALLAGVYQAYYPPPQVLQKSVTPSTKTIVLLS